MKQHPFDAMVYGVMCGISSAMAYVTFNFDAGVGSRAAIVGLTVALLVLTIFTIRKSP